MNEVLARKGARLYHRYPNTMLHSAAVKTDPFDPRDVPAPSTSAIEPKEHTASSLRWSVWPAKRMPIRVCFVALVMCLTVVWATSMHIAYGVIAAFLLLSATTDALFPTQYTLDVEGLEVRNPFRRVRRKYAQFENAYSTTGSLYLRYASHSRLLRRRRSVWVRCPENQTDVEAVLEKHLVIANEDQA